MTLTRRREPDAPAGDPPSEARPGRHRAELPAVAVVGVLAIGLLGISLGHWRKGAIVMGIAPLLAGVLRLVLPARDTGLLAVRGRTFDVVLLLTLGVVVIVLAYVVPVYYRQA